MARGPPHKGRAEDSGTAAQGPEHAGRAPRGRTGTRARAAPRVRGRRPHRSGKAWRRGHSSRAETQQSKIAWGTRATKLLVEKAQGPARRGSRAEGGSLREAKEEEGDRMPEAGKGEAGRRRERR